MIKSELDEVLQSLLQTEVDVRCNEKALRSGKFLLYSFSDYHLNLSILSKKQLVKELQLPMPFAVEKHNNKILLNYTNKALSHDNPELLVSILNIPAKENSRLYDSIVTIYYE